MYILHSIKKKKNLAVLGLGYNTQDLSSLVGACELLDAA